MKLKSKLSTLTVFSIILLSASCTGRGQKNASDSAYALEHPQVEFEGYTFDVIAEVGDADSINTEGWQYSRASGRGMLPKRIAGHDISQLRDSLQNIAQVLTAETGDIVAKLPEYLTPTCLNPDSVPACSSYTNSLTVSLLTPQLVVWRDYASVYQCNAAHGAYRTLYLNYSIPEGKVLTLADLFQPGYEEELAEMIREKLKDMEVDLMVPSAKINVPADFEMTCEGINFIFGIYEIAPYSSGEIKVEFNGYEIEHLLTPTAVSLIFSPNN